MAVGFKSADFNVLFDALKFSYTAEIKREKKNRQETDRKSRVTQRNNLYNLGEEKSSSEVKPCDKSDDYINYSTKASVDTSSTLLDV